MNTYLLAPLFVSPRSVILMSSSEPGTIKFMTPKPSVEKVLQLFQKTVSSVACSD